MSTAVNSETYKDRLRKYERREATILWLGAGFAGLVALANTSTFNTAPSWLRAVEITDIIVGAAFLGLARVKFEWQGTLIKRAIAKAEISATSALPADKQKWPADAEDCYTSTFTCILIGGIVMIVCFWWPVFVRQQ